MPPDVPRPDPSGGHPHIGGRRDNPGAVLAGILDPPSAISPLMPIPIGFPRIAETFIEHLPQVTLTENLKVPNVCKLGPKYLKRASVGWR